MMQTVLHPAANRGHADHGWLRTWHSFSFADYYDPGKIRYGSLRVLNEDYVSPGTGFGTHPHDNMEIVTIPLSGALEHRDSMGNGSVIHAGEIQIMSAGTGIYHSEFNPSSDEDVHLLQIWVFPAKKNVEPRYGQMKYEPNQAVNGLLPLISPVESSNTLWLHQQAWFTLGYGNNAGSTLTYVMQGADTGLYAMALEGEIKTSELVLKEKDAAGLSGQQEFRFDFATPGRLLLIEVPLKF
jgi:quercetin 2,3-dioxygenase